MRSRTSDSSTTVKSRPSKRAAAFPSDLHFEDSTLRAAAFVLFRRLIGSGLSPDAAATLLTERLHGQLLLELKTDLECLREADPHR